MLAKSSSGISHSNSSKAHSDCTVSAIPAPSLLGKATLSFDKFKLLGTPRHSLTFKSCSIPDFSYLSKAFGL